MEQFLFSPKNLPERLETLPGGSFESGDFLFDLSMSHRQDG
ncbi:hypothetical protein [Methanosarcina lacustris]|nr:hypothetical protein [Methanosarcina lacustris]